jgi:predicted Zn finger-like uncharacterized protein
VDPEEDKEVVVICPKCKTRLKVDEGKLTAGGSRFKCPRCATILLVKKPLPVPEKPVDNVKILVAHSNPGRTEEITSLLKKKGYLTITATDGIEAMVKAIKELPFLAIIEVALPKIYGFEVCKRLKLRPETKNIKVILVSSPYDKTRYKREPESLYDADEYIEEHRIAELLTDTVEALRGAGFKKTEEKVEKPSEAPVRQTVGREAEQQVEQVKTPEKIVPSDNEEKIERARRLARAIVSDIYLYNTAKAEESIKTDTFFQVFSAEIKEGRKLYESRIPPEIKSQGDFFRDVMKGFVENKKKNS